ncbi:MAG: hypothetical protein H7647_05915, partial [Candidatus Heimdallarchaeota archaeon]|nr:hypothetical protein [Candidatus Heimdallarchaeota archaeon]MCK4253961.1 hypothetical protein [Candidatus Heimdallarchaeota archaeon]
LTTQEFVSVDQLPVILQDWFYIYSSGTIVKQGQVQIYLLLKNPYFSPRIAILLKNPLSKHDISPGRQIKIFEGKIRSVIPNESTINGYAIDLLLEVEEKDVKFIFRGPFGMKIIL